MSKNIDDIFDDTETEIILISNFLVINKTSTTQNSPYKTLTQKKIIANYKLTRQVLGIVHAISLHSLSHSVFAFNE
jgi:hypothetical protein